MSNPIYIHTATRMGQEAATFGQPLASNPYNAVEAPDCYFAWSAAWVRVAAVNPRIVTTPDEVALVIARQSATA